MSMSLNEDQSLYWQKYLAQSRFKDHEDIVVSASMPGDGAIADGLVALYLNGKKRAGTGLVKDYEQGGDPLPEVGNFWIVLDSSGKPRCILRTVKVIKQSFDCVREDIAAAEGEGDLSVEYWQQAHRLFFSPQLAKLGIKDLDPEEVITEFFELVYP